jgi:hypothetical protein
MRIDDEVFSRGNLRKYFSSVFDERVEILSIRPIGNSAEQADEHIDDIKGWGYGIPILIELKIDESTKRVVLSTMRPGGFGHDHFSDRAAVLLWQHSTFNKLKSHVKSLDVGAFTSDGQLKSLGDCAEFFILTEFLEGNPYHMDLDRLKVTKRLTELDKVRCEALSSYLAELHSMKSEEKPLYIRRIRNLLGHGEGIMGLTDSYPTPLDYVDTASLAEIEKRCVDWKWKLKGFSHRLSQVHGDYHPWNILFRGDDDFVVLDRSRGEWGEPADDLSAMTINYLFYSLQTYGRLTEVFETLFNLFWTQYLDKTGDEEVLSVIQPFFAWRALVVASPIWYPQLPISVRTKLINFIFNAIEADSFDLKNVNSYFLSSR